MQKKLCTLKFVIVTTSDNRYAAAILVQIGKKTYLNLFKRLYTCIERNQVTYGIVFTSTNKQAAAIFMAILASVLRKKHTLKLMREINGSYACMKFGLNRGV